MAQQKPKKGKKVEKRSALIDKSSDKGKAKKPTAKPATVLAKTTAKSGKSSKTKAAKAAAKLPVKVKAQPPDRSQPKPLDKSVRKEAAAKPAKTGRTRASKGCSEPGCTQPSVADQYCRLHYIKNWSAIINSRRAQARQNLNKYIENLSEKFPDEYMEKIRDDLSNEGTFHARLRELGFREEYEVAGGGDNPFQMETVDEFVGGLKFEE